MTILQKLHSSCQQYNATLIAVSKTQALQAIEQLYQQGQRVFAENRVQDLCERHTALPCDIEWHLIGHLQTNKVKYIASFVTCIHSIDSLRLLHEINREAAKHQRKIDVLLQFHVAQEDTKFGLNVQEAQDILNYVQAHQNEFAHVAIVGIMGMASFTQNQVQVRSEFAQLKNIFTLLKNTYFPFEKNFKHISMGMSSDYEIALQEGSTMIRVGSLLF